MVKHVIVDLDSVSRIYTMGELTVPALRGVSLQVNQGESIGIMGPSGSGKTTLLNLIGALDKPTAGTVTITTVRRNKISFVFQFFNLLPVLSAYENVELPLLISGVEEAARKERVDHLMGLVGLTERAEHRPDELSGGEQQRVAIARALAKPEGTASSVVVLADEPTGDLDQQTGEDIMRILIDLTKGEGGTLIVVTHDPDVGKQMDKVYKMRDGQVEGVV